MEIQFKTDKGIELPCYAKEGDTGLDVRAVKILAIYLGSRSKEDKNPERYKRIVSSFKEGGSICIRPNERFLFGTGLFPELPSGTGLMVRPKSGQSLKKGFEVVMGTVEYTYKGEIGIVVKNTSDKLIRIDLNERIAQIVPELQVKVDISRTEFLSDSVRGAEGFGSSGIK